MPGHSDSHRGGPSVAFRNANQKNIAIGYAVYAAIMLAPTALCFLFKAPSLLTGIFGGMSGSYAAQSLYALRKHFKKS